MSTELCTVTEETALPEIARLMEDRKIKRVPVVQGRELVGIVSRADLLRAVISLESDPLAASGDDAKIHQRLLAELKKQPWAVPALDDSVHGKRRCCRIFRRDAR